MPNVVLWVNDRELEKLKATAEEFSFYSIESLVRKILDMALQEHGGLSEVPYYGED